MKNLHGIQRLLLLAPFLLVSSGCFWGTSTTTTTMTTSSTPASITYSPSNLTFVQSVPGGPYVPQFQPKQFENNEACHDNTYSDLNYGIVPDLPLGIALDPETGAIGGQCETTLPMTVYTVTVYDLTDLVTIDEITVQVVANQAPSDLSYEYENAVFVVDQ